MRNLMVFMLLFIASIFLYSYPSHEQAPFGALKGYDVENEKWVTIQLTSTGIPVTVVGSVTGATAIYGINTIPIGGALGYYEAENKYIGMIVDSTGRLILDSSSGGGSLPVASPTAPIYSWTGSTTEATDYIPYAISAESLILPNLSGAIITSTNIVTAMAELDSALSDEESTGVVEWLGTGDYWSITGTDFNLLRGGIGRIRGKLITWEGGQSSSLGACTGDYVFIDSNGEILTKEFSAVSSQDYYDYIPLFEIFCNGATTVVVKEDHPYNFPTGVSIYLHENAGPVIHGSGAIITQTATGDGSSPDDRSIDIVGNAVFDDHGISTDITASTGQEFHHYYTDGSGNWTRHSLATPFPMVYDNAGTPTALTVGKFGIFTLYVSKDNKNTDTPTYFSVMGGVNYNNLAQAQTRLANGENNKATNELAVLELAQLGNIIVQNNASGGIIADVIVAKDTFNERIVGGGVIGSHSLLQDLDSDDHLQYILIAGTRLFTGAFGTDNYTLPYAIGTASQVLSVPSSGTELEWVDQSGGGGGISAITVDVNGLSIETVTGINFQLGEGLTGEVDDSGNLTIETAWHSYTIPYSLTAETVFTFEADTTNKVVHGKCFLSDRSEVIPGISYETGDSRFFFTFTTAPNDEATLKYRLENHE